MAKEKEKSNVFKYWEKFKNAWREFALWSKDRIEELTAKRPLSDFNSMPKKVVDQYKQQKAQLNKLKRKAVILGLSYSFMAMMMFHYFGGAPLSFKLFLIGGSAYFLAHDAMDWIERTVKGMFKQ